MKLIGSIILLALISAFSYSDSRTMHPFVSGQFSETELNSIHSDAGPVFMLCDSTSLPLFYYQEIFTGVCLNKLCKPVDIVIYWDASGTFLGFYSPEAERLTKKDHVTFTDYEYFILYTILNNPYSVLGKLEYEALTSKNAMQEVDAVSGSTTIVDKNAVVQGAAYTCFTLWHLANDTTITNSLRANTHRALNKSTASTALVNSNVEISQLHPTALTLYLHELNQDNKLKKYKYQRKVTEQIGKASPLNTLIINNYLSRQVFIFPEIEATLAKDGKTDDIFNRMIGK